MQVDCLIEARKGLKTLVFLKLQIEETVLVLNCPLDFISYMYRYLFKSSQNTLIISHWAI